MASTWLAHLWSAPKDKSVAQTDPIPISQAGAEFVAETMDAPISLASARMLPIELWIEILEGAPRAILAQVMLVSRSLSEVAEGILYRCVSLKWNTSEVLKFSESIAACPRRAALVVDISIFHIDGMEDCLPFMLPKLLNALPNLRSLKLQSWAPNIMRCDGIFLNVRLPHLRAFTSNLKISSDNNAFFLFLAAHAHLEELDLRFSHPPDMPPIHDRLDARPLLSLRVLACSARFFNSRPPVLPALTHLYRTSYLTSEAMHIAALLGPQLVSLRLRGRLVVGADRTAPCWSLADVAARFPRLRFLQVDSPYKERPYVDTSVVDWLRPRPSRDPAHDGSEAAPAAQLTVVWAYYEDGFWSDAAWARTYDRFLDDAALRCLRLWARYIERVVYEHTVKPYNMESLMLDPGTGDGEESERVVRVRDAGIGDDYWKFV